MEQRALALRAAQTRRSGSQPLLRGTARNRGPRVVGRRGSCRRGWGVGFPSLPVAALDSSLLTRISSGAPSRVVLCSSAAAPRLLGTSLSLPLTLAQLPSPLPLPPLRPSHGWLPGQ